MSDDDGTSLQALIAELVTSASGASAPADHAEYKRYVWARLNEELSGQEEAYELISVLAAFAAHTIRAWAEDTDRDPAMVLQTINLAMYTDDET